MTGLDETRSSRLATGLRDRPAEPRYDGRARVRGRPPPDLRAEQAEFAPVGASGPDSAAAPPRANEMKLDRAVARCRGKSFFRDHAAVRTPQPHHLDIALSQAEEFTPEVNLPAAGLEAVGAIPTVAHLVPVRLPSREAEAEQAARAVGEPDRRFRRPERHGRAAAPRPHLAPRIGVDRAISAANAEMQVREFGPAGETYQAQDRAGGHPLALGDADRVPGHVAVESGPAAAMGEADTIAAFSLQFRIVAPVVGHAVANGIDPPRRRRQHLGAAPHVGEGRDADIGPLVAVVAERAAGEVAGRRAGGGVDVILHETVAARFAVDGELEAGRLGRRRRDGEQQQAQEGRPAAKAGNRRKFPARRSAIHGDDAIRGPARSGRSGERRWRQPAPSPGACGRTPGRAAGGKSARAPSGDRRRRPPAPAAEK